MLILGMHVEHDGSVAVVEDGQLTLCVESQKDNGPRYAKLTRQRLDDALKWVPNGPDVVAVGGWFGRTPGYHGHDAASVDALEGGDERSVRFIRTSHERSHIFCAYGLSPFPQGQPCYALVWEGDIGAFYEIDADCVVSKIVSPMAHPGHRYAFMFELAHPAFSDESAGMSLGVAGKLMALAGVPEADPRDQHASDLIADVLARDWEADRVCKGDYRGSPFYNIGVEDPRFRGLARRFSDALFGVFYRAALAAGMGRRPLLIAGGCGLNCEWNTRWRDCGLFTDVFIPPCTDDSGCAIGAAVDAQRALMGSAKVDWTVYCGEPFAADESSAERVDSELDLDAVASVLAEGGVVAWVQGRYECGPRALGNRSLLAAPFAKEARDRLNAIKRREWYRPVAPVCLEEEVHAIVRWEGPSSFMLHFQAVADDKLKAITHHDGSARVQTVNEQQNKPLTALLRAFKARTGYGVLCNTSLNYPGRGFINSAGDLRAYCIERRIDAWVVGDRFSRLPRHVGDLVDGAVSALLPERRRDDADSPAAEWVDPVCTTRSGRDV